jgi:pimeloyl-ACP methyl ester carboxylesterase
MIDMNILKFFRNLGIIFCISFIVYKYMSSFVLKQIEKSSFTKENLKIKEIDINGQRCTYAEGGEGTPLVFIHGFQSNKISWLKYIKPFKDSYKIIIPDLPAHGSSLYNESQKFDLESLSAFLNEFFEKKNLKDVCLIGTSLGGGVVMKFAESYPDRLDKLILINPVGIKPETEKEYLKIIETNERLFFPNNYQELDDLFTYLRGSSLEVNFSIKKYILKRSFLKFLVEKQALFKRVFKDFVMGEGVETILNKIKVPTLIIMGDKDNVSRKVDFDIYSNEIHESKSIMIQDGYHILNGTALDKALDEMKTFIDKS